MSWASTRSLQHLSGPAGQEHSYKFGSLTHADKATRLQAIEHNLECIEIGQRLGSTALTVWIADGSNFPGQAISTPPTTAIWSRFPKSTRRCRGIGWSSSNTSSTSPPFYATVISDWGSNFMAASELGPKAKCLVDLGHHAPTQYREDRGAADKAKNSRGSISRFEYATTILDSGSIDPFRLFLVFSELVDAEMRKTPDFAPAYMIDQSHNVPTRSKA